MIHTNMPRNCVVFLLLCEPIQSAIYGSQKFDSHKWPTVLVDEVKGKPWIFEACLCGSLILLLQHLSTHMHFVTNAYKRFSKTNSTDPRQRVPLNSNSLCCSCTRSSYSACIIILLHKQLQHYIYVPLIYCACNLLVDTIKF